MLLLYDFFQSIIAAVHQLHNLGAVVKETSIKVDFITIQYEKLFNTL